MKRWLLTTFLGILNSSCVMIGTQTTLTPEKNSDWKEVQRFGEHYFSYECASMQLHVYPIGVKHKISFIGLVIPIFPVMKESDYSDQKPLMLFVPKGIPEDKVFSYFKINNIEVGFRVDRTQNSIPFIESTNNDYHLEKIDTVEVGFNRVADGCNIPSMRLIKESGSWHEFILSMGP